MEKEKRKIPEIRFPGFTDDWEQRKLQEILKVNSGRDYKHLGSGSIPVYGTGGYMLSVNDKLSDKDAIGIGRKGTIDKPQYLKAPFWTVDTLFFMTPLNNFDLQFLYTMTQKINWKKMDESTGVPSLSKAVIEKVNQNIPSYQEQIIIGRFFKQLDNTFALHQRKLEILKNSKQTLLQKMFPQTGENVPEIRFPGFTEDWEQRKAKELFIPRVEKNQPDLPVLSVTQDNGVVYRDQVGIDIKYDKTTLKNYKVIHQGDFVISLRSFQGGFEISDKLGITSPAYTIFIPKNTNSQDSLFWKTKFKTFTFIESLKTVTFGIRDGKSISFSEFGDLKLFYPKSIKEQQKIGTFFKQLDNTIALHQYKLENLKQLKQTLLNKLFI